MIKESLITLYFASDETTLFSKEGIIVFLLYELMQIKKVKQEKKMHTVRLTDQIMLETSLLHVIINESFKLYLNP